MTRIILQNEECTCASRSRDIGVYHGVKTQLQMAKMVSRKESLEIPSQPQAENREQTQQADSMNIQVLPPGTDVIYHGSISQMFHILPYQHHHLRSSVQISEPVKDILFKNTSENQISGTIDSIEIFRVQKTCSRKQQQKFLHIKRYKQTQLHRIHLESQQAQLDKNFSTQYRNHVKLKTFFSLLFLKEVLNMQLWLTRPG